MRETLIFVNKHHSAVITRHNETAYTVVAYVEDGPSVAYDTRDRADAERWAKAVIMYPDNR